ncbi:hypothetical protein M0Q50_10705 [bacterium]|jgi:hypothetical protein|nr:hypothetical protein [bacterium]
MLTKYNKFINENYDDFNVVFNNIKTYIGFVLKSKIKIDEYVTNTHIAEIFKEVLQSCEKENMYPEIYHNVKRFAADYVVPERRHLYDYINGEYFPKETDRISFLDNIDDYFNLQRLKNDGQNEIIRTYQKLRERDDIIRNNMKLIDTRIPDEYNMLHKIKKNLKSDKIKIK